MNLEHACMVRICPDEPKLYLIRGTFEVISMECAGFSILKKVPGEDKTTKVISILLSNGISAEDIYITQRNSDNTFSVRHFIGLDTFFYKPFEAPDNAYQCFHKTPYGTKYGYEIGWFAFSTSDCPENQRKIRHKKMSKKVVENNGMILCFRAFGKYYKICTISVNGNGDLEIDAPKMIEIKIHNGHSFIGM